MNILLLSQFFSTVKGGGEYVFNMIAKRLAENDHNVWIITNKIIDETYDIHKNIHLVFVPPTLEYKGGLPPGFLDNIGYAVNATIAGLKIIKKEKIDIIHSNNFSPALAGSMLSYLTSRPHITSIHDVFSLCGKNYWKLWGRQSKVSKLNVFLAPFFEKMMIRLNHDAIHTVSQATCDDLIQFGAKKPIYVIPNTVEIKKIENPDVVPFQFIYIGRLVFYKNLEVVIRAIEIVKKTYPKITLVIVGGGPYKEPLEKIVNQLKLQENIRFAGFVSADEKARLLAGSQALVFPSLCEGFGLVILEAFAQGKPVLVSDVRPLSDIVSNKINGLVISPHDESQWAKSISSIIENPENSLHMGSAGQELLKTTYNIDKMTRKILEMYHDFVK
ncbi:MAG: glycosyltransferase family 4 protein [Nitrosopumilaceae archaeon]